MGKAKKATLSEDAIEVLSGLGEITRLDKDLKKLIRTLNRDEVRCIVNYYYNVQENRMRSSKQINAASKAGTPHDLMVYLNAQTQVLENQIAKAMDEWTEGHPVAKALKDNVYGIGPIISAGLVAHFDIHRAATAGAFWRYAGLDPTSVWSKGEKRPWNAALKTLCWKVGQSFMKFSNATDKDTGAAKCFYGDLYRQKKAELVAKNQGGGFKGLADSVLKAKKFRDVATKAKYESGMLPDGHIDAMARRWAVKLFLSNLHELWCAAEGIPCPRPYSMAIQGHAHYIMQPELANLINVWKNEARI
jgi:hypothetical protein